MSNIELDYLAVGYTSEDTFMLDFDNKSYGIVLKYTKWILRNYDYLFNTAIILQTSEHSYGVIFLPPNDFDTLIRLNDTLASLGVGDALSLRERQRRGDFTIRISGKMHISGKVKAPVVKAIVYTDMCYNMIETISKVMHYLTMFNKPDALQVVHERNK